MYLPKNILTFGYDQARDAILTQQIIHGHLKIQGPPASVEGLHHGVFYYYFLAPGYLLGKGSPIITAYWVALFNSLTVFLVFFIAFNMTKKVFPSLLAAFLFAISFESVQYATWLSNPTIAIWTVPIMYLGLWGWTQEKSSRWKNVGPVLVGIGLGLSIQAEIFLSYHLIPVLIWLYISRKTINKSQIVSFLAFLILGISTMVAAEMKFGFPSIHGIRQLLSSQDSSLAYAKSLGDYLVLYLNQVGRIFAFNTYPGNIGLGGGLIMVLALVGIFNGERTLKFLSTWIFSHLAVVSLGGTSTPFLMVGIGPAVSIILALYLFKWWQSGLKLVFVLVLIFLIYGNLSTILKQNPKGSTLFSIQNEMILSRQLSAIDYTYNSSNGKEFSINTLTSPLWINLVWTYLYKWHGNSKYGYLPSWHGHSQVGQPDGLTEVINPDKLSFLLLEPTEGIPSEYLKLTIGEEDSKSKLLEQKNFGEIIVQKRQRN